MRFNVYEMKIMRVSAVLLLVVCFSSLPDDVHSLRSDVEADEVGKRSHIVASEERTAKETFVSPPYNEILIRTGPRKRAPQKSELSLITLGQQSDDTLHSSDFSARAPEEKHSPSNNYPRSSDHGKQVERKLHDSNTEKRASVVRHYTYVYNPNYRFVDLGKRAPKGQQIPFTRLAVGTGKRTPQKDELPSLVTGKRNKGELHSLDVSARALREKFYPYYPIPGHEKRTRSKLYDSDIEKRIARERYRRYAKRSHPRYSSVNPRKRDGDGSIVSKFGCIPPGMEEQFNLENDPGALRIRDSMIEAFPCTLMVLSQGLDWSKKDGKLADMKTGFENSLRKRDEMKRDPPSSMGNMHG